MKEDNHTYSYSEFYIDSLKNRYETIIKEKDFEINNLKSTIKQLEDKICKNNEAYEDKYKNIKEGVLKESDILKEELYKLAFDNVTKNKKKKVK